MEEQYKLEKFKLPVPVLYKISCYFCVYEQAYRDEFDSSTGFWFHNHRVAFGA